MKVDKTGMPGVDGTGRSGGSKARGIDNKNFKDAEITHKISPDQFEKVFISSKARDSAKAQAIAQAAPDVREDKVAALKAKISDGTYKFNPEAIASNLVDEHLSTS